MRQGGWLLGAAALVLCASAGLTACKGSSPAAGTRDAGADAQAQAGDASMAVPFEPDPPRVYVAKVKNVLVGLPPTDQEVAAVAKDPSQLRGLIVGWMQLPSYSAKMLTFFQLAFQQTQVTINDFADQTYPRQAVANAYTRALLARNAQESFARTVLQLNTEGKPFTETMTTRRFMLTPALMELYAYLDVWQVDDAGKVTDRYGRAHLGQTITVGAAQGPIPIEQTLDPKSPNYMHWYDPDVANAGTGMATGCGGDPIVYPMRSDALHFLLYGSLIAQKGTAGNKCQQVGGSASAPQLTAADFDSWKMVTVRAPIAGEARTDFFDLPKLRSGTELVLTTPRLGFFSTPAFFANWQTNISNQMRVTTNQTLIVALGAAVDGTDDTVASSTPGLDTMHAQSGDCFGCHQSLDPTRSIFASTYSWNYHDQTEAVFASQKGRFVFHGVQKPLSGIADLGDTLAHHPLFAQAWVQKLCYYAGSSACDTDDPEFKRVVSVFERSGYVWNTLVAELLASPLITHAQSTQTASRHGVTIAVARRDHLCAALSSRLGLSDVCGLTPKTLKDARATVPQIATGLPSDGYGRGAIAPVLPNEPTLFYRAAVENVCATLATKVVDAKSSALVPGQKSWSSSAPEAAVADFVSTLMALTAGDPRTGKAKMLLLAHYNAALQGGATTTDALRSTFIVACVAPSSISIGL